MYSVTHSKRDPLFLYGNNGHSNNGSNCNNSGNWIFK